MTQPSPEKLERLLRELETANPYERKVAVERLGELETSNERIVRALEAVALKDGNPSVRQAAIKALQAPAHQPYVTIAIRKVDHLPGAAAQGKGRQFTDEERSARNWYWWLWLSPLLTVPTLLAILSPLYNPGPLIIATGVLGSALWHLVLLIPALGRRSEFVRWHGRQALMLAGLRTAVPLLFLAYDATQGGYGDFALWSIPFLLLVWLFGTIWGRRQAARGDCSLMRWFGRDEALPMRRRAKEAAAQPATRLRRVVTGELGLERLGADALVDMVRFHTDPDIRRRAVAELEKLGMVETL